MRRVPVKVRGNVFVIALVDDADYPLVAGKQWRLRRGGYAQHKTSRAGRQVVTVMHRLIAGLTVGDGLEVDHKNGNGLDCTRSNMRVVTHAQNMQNRTKATGRSRFRNVSWHRRRNRWQVRMTVGRVQYHGGYFTDEFEAALAAQRMRSELMPFALPDPEIAAELERREAVA